MFLGYCFLPELGVAGPFDAFGYALAVFRVFEAAIGVLGLYVAVHELDKQFLFQFLLGGKLVLGGGNGVVGYVLDDLGKGIAGHHYVSLG